MAKTITICPQCLKLNKVDTNPPGGKQPVCGSCKSQLPLHDAISELDTRQLQALIKSSPVPIVVDFWAPWCGPCRAFAPTFSAVADDNADKFSFVKINTEAHGDASQIFGVRGIPTTAIFLNGREIKRQSGAVPRDTFEGWLA